MHWPSLLRARGTSNVHLTHADPLYTHLMKAARMTPIIPQKSQRHRQRQVQEAQDRDQGNNVSTPSSSYLTCTVLTLSLGRSPPLAMPLKT